MYSALGWCKFLKAWYAVFFISANGNDYMEIYFVAAKLNLINDIIVLPKCCRNKQKTLLLEYPLYVTILKTYFCNIAKAENLNSHKRIQEIWLFKQELKKNKIHCIFKSKLKNHLYCKNILYANFFKNVKKFYL